MIKLIFKKGNVKKLLKVTENASILEIARKENIDLEGSCEGSIACSTCHVLVSKIWYEKLDKPTKEEVELLEILPNYSKNSRLGCQIRITKELDGIEISLPVEL